MPNPIIKIKRGTTTPVSLSTGELAVDLLNQNLFVGNASGVPITIGGSGTFATKAYADAAVAALGSSGGAALTQEIADRIAGDDALDLRSDDLETKTQNIDSAGTSAGTTKINGGVEIAGWASFAGNTTTILNNGDLEFTAFGGGMVQGLRAPSNGTDATNKNYVDSAVSALGSVFHYVGDVSSASTPLDLTTLSDQATGAYYRVDADGAYTDGATTFNAKVGDAFVKTTTGWQKLDNVDAVVSGTANEISVSGDENAGYVVSLDPVFLGRVGTIEGDLSYAISTANLAHGNANDALSQNITQDGLIADLQTKTQNIDLAGTVAGTTVLTGDLSVSGSITDAIIDGGVY